MDFMKNIEILESFLKERNQDIRSIGTDFSNIIYSSLEIMSNYKDLNICEIITKYADNEKIRIEYNPELYGLYGVRFIWSKRRNGKIETHDRVFTLDEYLGRCIQVFLYEIARYEHKEVCEYKEAGKNENVLLHIEKQ